MQFLLKAPRYGDGKQNAVSFFQDPVQFLHMLQSGKPVFELVVSKHIPCTASVMFHCCNVSKTAFACASPELVGILAILRS